MNIPAVANIFDVCVFYDGLRMHVLKELQIKINEELDTKKYRSIEHKTNILLLILAFISNKTSRMHCGCTVLECLEAFSAEIDLTIKSGILVDLKRNMYCIMLILQRLELK